MKAKRRRMETDLVSPDFLIRTLAFVLREMGSQGKVLNLGVS